MGMVGWTCCCAMLSKTAPATPSCKATIQAPAFGICPNIRLVKSVDTRPWWPTLTTLEVVKWPLFRGPQLAFNFGNPPKTALSRWSTRPWLRRRPPKPSGPLMLITTAILTS